MFFVIKNHIAEERVGGRIDGKIPPRLLRAGVSEEQTSSSVRDFKFDFACHLSNF